MDKPQIDVRRHIVGVIAIILLIAALVLYLFSGDRQDQTTFVIGMCVRLGCVLMAIWLAWPQVSQLANWTPKAVLVGLLVILIVGVIASKRLLPIAILFVVMAVGLQLVARFLQSRRS